MSLWWFTWLELKDRTCVTWRRWLASARKAYAHLQQWLFTWAARPALGAAPGAPGKYRSGTWGAALTTAVEQG